MNNLIYLYNGSFLNLLSLVDYLIKKKIKPANIKTTLYSPTLFDNLINLDIPDDKNVINDYIKKTSAHCFRDLYYVYLSNDESKELIIYYFYHNSLKYGKEVIYHRNLKCVDRLLKICKYVGGEAHKYKGFIRFNELKNGGLYAEIEPVNNIIELVSWHFTKRLKNEYWIIKDKKRNLLSIYDKKTLKIVLGDNFILNDLKDTSDEFADLWKVFYKTIGITERKNDRCRMNFMPKRYWKYMIEMEDEL